MLITGTCAAPGEKQTLGDASERLRAEKSKSETPAAPRITAPASPGPDGPLDQAETVEPIDDEPEPAPPARPTQSRTRRGLRILRHSAALVAAFIIEGWTRP